jgi:serine/threonine-protein kinase
MAFVPAGNFQMGCDVERNIGYPCKITEFPLHTIYVEAFYIDIHEVTNRLYAQCVQASACTEPEEKRSLSRSSYYSNPEYDNYPVVAVNWVQAKTYCQWRGAELPTEAQWEKAARGTDGRTYPWGDRNLDCTLANSRDEAADQDCVGDTAAVGSYPAGASPYGIMDMAGNVQEWVNDWYQEDYYSFSPSSNPPGPATGTDKVIRSSAWYLPSYFMRVAWRIHNGTDNYAYDTGFRCVTLPGS